MVRSSTILIGCKTVVCDPYFYFWEDCECADIPPSKSPVPMIRIDGEPFAETKEIFPTDLLCEVINHRLEIHRAENGERLYTVIVEGVPLNRDYAIRVFYLHKIELYFDDLYEALRVADENFPIGDTESCFPELKKST